VLLPAGLAAAQRLGRSARCALLVCRHGINTSHWFAQGVRSQRIHQRAFPELRYRYDIALIKAMGFDHVRLSVNPEPMLKTGRADEIPVLIISAIWTPP